MHRQDPTIATHVIHSAYSAEEYIDLNEKGFKFAFGLMDSKSKKRLDDYSRIEWEVTFRNRVDNK
jgi:hypothetical protein